ncbi:MAG: hypothetical protein J6Y78_03465 [Paludibacteraceae bacterium]|nr:hypothetical protein [Paludibacteraceae bacterium]
MGRPKTANPKKEFIGTKTTRDYKVRFDKVCERKNLKGDDWLVLFLGVFENDNDDVKSERTLQKMRIREINKRIRELENEKISCENILEELPEVTIEETKDIDKALITVLQRFNNQSIYNIDEWVSENRPFIENQAYIHGVNYDELERLILENS